MQPKAAKRAVRRASHSRRSIASCTSRSAATVLQVVTATPVLNGCRVVTARILFSITPHLMKRTPTRDQEMIPLRQHPQMKKVIHQVRNKD